MKIAYEIKLERQSTDIAAVDLKHEQAQEGAVKEALGQQLATMRATRNALLAKQQEEVSAIEMQYDGYEETKRIDEKKKEALAIKAKEKAEALFQRKYGAHTPNLICFP